MLRWVHLAAVSAFATLFLSACASTPISYGGPTQLEDVEIGIEGVLKEFGRVIAVEGVATNRGEGDFDRIEVVFELLDENGIKVGDAAAEANGLRAGQTWRFDAFATVKYRAEVRRVRVDRVELSRG